MQSLSPSVRTRLWLGAMVCLLFAIAVLAFVPLPFPSSLVGAIFLLAAAYLFSVRALLR